MIIYGSKAVFLKTEKSENATCPSCGTRGSIYISIFSKHAHVFWIPFFPIGKTGASQCMHCKNILKPNEMTEEIRTDYYRIMKESKTPIWQFIGVAIFTALIFLGIYNSGEDAKKDLKYIASPQVGDVYEFKTTEGNYTALKVINITGDTVFIATNKYEVNKSSGLYKINKAENYSEENYGVLKGKLKEMYDSTFITDVIR